MSEVKFTKGPWYVHNNDVYLEVFSDKGAICDTCMSGHQFDGGDCTEGKSAKANAHLIAAAPEMYEMLARCARELAKNGYETETVHELLAKARGE